MKSKEVKCPNCEHVNTVSKWNIHTALAVTGVGREEAVECVSTCTPGFFYVCPTCDQSVDGSELRVNK